MRGVLLKPIQEGRSKDKLNYIWHDYIERYDNLEQPFWDWRIDMEVEQ